MENRPDRVRSLHPLSFLRRRRRHRHPFLRVITGSSSSSQKRVKKSMSFPLLVSFKNSPTKGLSIRWKQNVSLKKARASLYIVRSSDRRLFLVVPRCSLLESFLPSNNTKVVRRGRLRVFWSWTHFVGTKHVNQQ